MPYTFSVFVFEDQGGGVEGDLLGYQRFENRDNIPTFLCEFTPTKLDDMNKPIVVKVVDNSTYTAGMDRLCLDLTVADAWNTMRKSVMFDYSRYGNTFIDTRERVRRVSVESFRSVILEFSSLCMEQRRV